MTPTPEPIPVPMPGELAFVLAGLGILVFGTALAAAAAWEVVSWLS